MTTEELKACIKSLGWTMRERTKSKQQYIYAVKRSQGKLIEKYLFPSALASGKHQFDIWEKLLNTQEDKQH